MYYFFPDVPNFSDPDIPVVAREILQRMIRQFAAEYTSKTSSPQDNCSDSQPRSDQSLPTPPLLPGAPPSTSPAATLAGPAHNQNPVLSKLLMADQDAPLDLTIKKPPAEPSEQGSVKLNISVTEQLIQDWTSVLVIGQSELSIEFRWTFASFFLQMESLTYLLKRIAIAATRLSVVPAFLQPQPRSRGKISFFLFVSLVSSP